VGRRSKTGIGWSGVRCLRDDQSCQIVHAVHCERGCGRPK
jgi:hypothetical protein